MGWPRKEEGLRLYFERKAKTYLLYDPDTQEGIGEVTLQVDPSTPCLATTSVTSLYLMNHCRRVAWIELPRKWQDAFTQWMIDDPTTYRGLWRME